MIFQFVLLASLLSNIFSPQQKQENSIPYFDWNNATIYFLLTDRFYNGNPNNDINFNRTVTSSPLRGFNGGDIQGITQKIKEGYFQKLGVDVIWFSPVLEQIHGCVDEGQGNTYAYHGYWTRDWTAMEPNFGNENDLRELMQIAHANHIRIMMDVVINHTGPVTDLDPVWPSDWVRTEPQCTYQDSQSTISCTLVKNLPDILTNQTKNVELPKNLLEKWKSEGRLEKELAELDAFFKRTRHPKTPRYYIIKWLTDYIREFGIDGFRVDTVKHTEADVWSDLAIEAKKAFRFWKAKHQEPIQEKENFYMLGEVYNYNIQSGPDFDFGDIKVNYYKNGFQSMINFGFKGDAYQDYETLFSSYSEMLHSENYQGISVMNYISSHDDSYPYDISRSHTFESANKLLLSPGQAQIYYGDEIARPLIIKNAQGDANLRGLMNWDDKEHKELLEHWQKLGRFRQRHPAIGAGEHRMLISEPYLFVRSYVKANMSDRVIIGIDLPKTSFVLNVSDYYQDGNMLQDKYSGDYYLVERGQIHIKTDKGIVLLELFKK